MDTIYRCHDCGYETSDRALAKKHNCKDLIKIKQIRLECYCGYIRFNKKTATYDRRCWDVELESARVWNNGTGVEVYTEDLSEAHEKKLKNDMLQVAVSYREGAIKELEREIGKLKSRMSEEKKHE